MYYAGFLLRLYAGVIDFLVFTPVIVLYFYLRSVSWEVAIIVVVPYFFLWSIYNIYFHGRWGQTIGKRVANIKVVRADGSLIIFRHAFYRHAVDFIFAICLSIAQVSALLSISKPTFEAIGWRETNILIYSKIPVWGHWGKTLSTIWIYSELFILLINKKKRALHDFIAGTVVINLRSKKEPSPITEAVNDKLDTVLSMLKK